MAIETEIRRQFRRRQTEPSQGEAGGTMEWRARANERSVRPRINPKEITGEDGASEDIGFAGLRGNPQTAQQIASKDPFNQIIATYNNQVGHQREATPLGANRPANNLFAPKITREMAIPKAGTIQPNVNYFTGYFQQVAHQAGINGVQLAPQPATQTINDQEAIQQRLREAQQIAVQAQQTAVQAQQTAEQAQQTAVQAQQIAEQAQQIAEQAQQIAEQAQQIATEVAQETRNAEINQFMASRPVAENRSNASINTVSTTIRRANSDNLPSNQPSGVSVEKSNDSRGL